MERIVIVSSALYIFGTLWSFISVFASSLTALVPVAQLGLGKPCDIYKRHADDNGSCLALYYWWVLTFGTVMAILLGLDLREQATFQCCMTAARALVILVMVGSLLAGERADFGLPLRGTDSSVPLVRWAGLATMLPIGIFCQLFQIGVPSLLQPLAQKKAFGRTFGTALGCTFAMYATLALSTIGLLGEDVDPSCNLNWLDYQPSASVAMAVALFPAIDCLSVFPMNAIFLSNNLMACLFQERWHAGQIARRTKYGFNLLCCVPPFVCAFAFPNLTKALDFTGIVGIVLPFIVTPWLHVASLQECRKCWGTEAFDRAEAAAGYALPWPFSSPGFVTAFGTVGCVTLLFCIVRGLVDGF